MKIAASTPATRNSRPWKAMPGSRDPSSRKRPMAATNTAPSSVMASANAVRSSITRFGIEFPSARCADTCSGRSIRVDPNQGIPPEDPIKVETLSHARALRDWQQARQRRERLPFDAVVMMRVVIGLRHWGKPPSLSRAHPERAECALRRTLCSAAAESEVGQTLEDVHVSSARPLDPDKLDTHLS